MTLASSRWPRLVEAPEDVDNRGMCGRFTQTFPLDWIEAWLAIDEIDPASASIAAPRANIAPSQPVLIALRDEGVMRLTVAQWGFRGNGVAATRRPINARAETVNDSPLFREAFATQRCIVPASGFFEWGPAVDEARVPYYFRVEGDSDPLLCLAALFARDARGLSVSILTIAATGVVGEIHDRMPVLLARHDAASWLFAPPGRASFLAKRSTEPRLSRIRVSTRVNDPRAEGLDLLAPLRSA